MMSEGAGEAGGGRRVLKDAYLTQFPSIVMLVRTMGVVCETLRYF